jgi:hypothetical protein
VAVEEGMILPRTIGRRASREARRRAIVTPAAGPLAAHASGAVMTQALPHRVISQRAMPAAEKGRKSS